MAVFALVRFVKAHPDFIKLRFPNRTDRKQYLEFITLSDVAQVAIADERQVVGLQVIGCELFFELQLHRSQIGVDAFEINIAADLERGADDVVFQIGGQQPHCRSDTGIRRHDHFGEAEHGGDFDPVQRAGAPEGDKGKLTRVDPLLHRARADRVRHIAVDHCQHPFGGVELVHAKRVGERLDCAVRGAFVELHTPAKEVVFVEAPEDEVRVSHGRLGAAAAVSGWARHGAGTPRSDAERTAVIDIGD